MEHEGGCHCGGVRYRVTGKPEHVSVCHCSDCRKSAGAPFVSWAAFRTADFKVEGNPVSYNSSANAYRHFCARCGTGIYYMNEHILPGLVDIQTATLDNPDALEPQLQVQTVEQIKWTHGLEALPKFERYPG